MRHKANGYVITGGPGAGKTTLLQALEKAGYTVLPEDARRIIRQQKATGGNGLPWKDPQRYFQLMWEAAVSRFLAFPAGFPCFFDRGMIDSICYAKMVGLPIAAPILQTACELRYNRKVFLLPPWRAIYRNDAERKQSWEEATQTFTQMKTIYALFEYETVLVPPLPTDQRVAFVQRQLAC